MVRANKQPGCCFTDKQILAKTKKRGSDKDPLWLKIGTGNIEPVPTPHSVNDAQFVHLRQQTTESSGPTSRRFSSIKSMITTSKQIVKVEKICLQ